MHPVITKLSNKPSVHLVLVCTVMIYFLFSLIYNLADFTGLHIDEVLLGYQGIKIKDHGVFSLHGMNQYTGSIFSSMLAGVFHFMDLNVANLRLMGASINFLGILLLTWNAYRWAGWRGVWVFAGLILALPGLIVLGKIAWEVTAFHLLLVAIKVSLISRLVYKGHLPIPAIVLFFTVTTFGTYNHFIFISESTALFFASAWLGYLYLLREFSAANSMRWNKTELLPIYRLNVLAILGIANCAYFFALKPSLSDSFFQQNPIISYSIIILPILLCSLIYHMLSSAKAVHFLMKALERHHQHVRFFTISLVVKVVVFSCLIILLYFLATRYFWAFLGTITSVLPLQRTLAIEITGLPFVAMHLFWLAIIGLFGSVFFTKLRNFHSIPTVEFRKLLFFLYPIMTVAVLFLFLPRTSTRHFLIAVCVFVGFLPLILSAFDHSSKKHSRCLMLFGALFGVHVIVGQGILLLALTSNIQQTPALVRYPTFEDHSEHFLKQTALFKHLKKNAICPTAKTTKYIHGPWQFYYLRSPYACKGGKFVEIEYCFKCTEPVPFFKLHYYHKPQL